MTMLVYVGTFTGSTRSEGIYVYRLDPASGALEHVQTVGGLYSPSFLAFHPQQPFLYAVERQADDPTMNDGAVSTFAIDAATGHLTLLNRQGSGGVSPAYVSVHPTGTMVFAANYGSGQVASLPVLDDGRVAPASSVIQHEGVRPGPEAAGGTARPLCHTGPIWALRAVL